MELWVPITLAAAFMQNLRSALQKHLKGSLSTSGATFCRFVYAVPLALAYVALLGEGFGFEWPVPNSRFALFAMVGGVTQITATALLVYLFSLRNFAVGTTYSKTETVQAAVFGLVILGESVSLAAALAIGISLAGVMFISVAKSRLTLRNLLLGWTGRAAFIGVLSGTFFGVSAVAYRAASLSLGGQGFLMQAAFTLACVVVFQTAVMAVWIRRREPGELTRVLRADDALDRGAAHRARLPVLAVCGHLAVERGDLAREPVPGLDAQDVDPVGKRLPARIEEALGFLVLHVAGVVDCEGKVPSLPEAAVFAAREPLMLRGGPAADHAFRPCRIGSILQAPTHTNHGWRLSVALGIGRR